MRIPVSKLMLLPLWKRTHPSMCIPVSNYHALHMFIWLSEFSAYPYYTHTDTYMYVHIQSHIYIYIVYNISRDIPQTGEAEVVPVRQFASRSMPRLGHNLEATVRSHRQSWRKPTIRVGYPQGQNHVSPVFVVFFGHKLPWIVNHPSCPIMIVGMIVQPIIFFKSRLFEKNQSSFFGWPKAHSSYPPCQSNLIIGHQGFVWPMVH